MTDYIHDEWCDTRLTVPSECNCYVGVIRGLESRIEVLEQRRTELQRGFSAACTALGIVTKRGQAKLMHCTCGQISMDDPLYHAETCPYRSALAAKEEKP